MARPPRTPEVDLRADETVSVLLPSGSTWQVYPREVSFFSERANRYRKDYALTNISDLAELDRVLQFETLSQRYMIWQSDHCDYWGEQVNASDMADLVKRNCVDEETEILTGAGWRTYKDLAVGDPVLTLNIDSGCAEWQNVEAIHLYEQPTTVLHLLTREHDSVSTPDHRWPVRPASGAGRTRPIRMEKSWRLRGGDTLIRSAQGGAALHATLADALVEVIAWFWTEGSAHKASNGRWYNGCIHQSLSANPDKCKAITSALTRLWGEPAVGSELPKNDGGVPLWRITTYMDDTMMKCVFSRSALAFLLCHFEEVQKKVVSMGFLRALTQTQLEQFIAISIDGDGWSRAWATKTPWAAGQGRALRQSEFERSDRFALACILAGMPVSLRPVLHPESKPGALVSTIAGTDWLVTLLTDRSCCPIRAYSASHRDVEWSIIDRVWCPQTPNGTWFARRGGTMYFTGNSTEIRMIKQALAIDKLTRDRQQGDDSVAVRWADIVKRAGEFKILRNDQFDMALELINELIAKVILTDRCNDDERKMLEVRDVDIIDWIRNYLTPRYRKIDADFRQGEGKYAGQRMWVEDLNR